jgi:hypothetical protein
MPRFPVRTNSAARVIKTQVRLPQYWIAEEGSAKDEKSKHHKQR